LIPAADRAWPFCGRSHFSIRVGSFFLNRRAITIAP
jgi:hypothetical protein